jgi:hypothetical protein
VAAVAVLRPSTPWRDNWPDEAVDSKAEDSKVEVTTTSSGLQRLMMRQHVLNERWQIVQIVPRLLLLSLPLTLPAQNSRNRPIVH